MSVLEGMGIVLMLLAAGFFLAGTVGLLRFPDVHSRLHALTKADNLGLGLLVAGLALQAESPAAAAKLALIWVLALVASAVSCYLIGNAALLTLTPRPRLPHAGEGEPLRGAPATGEAGVRDRGGRA